MRQLFFMFIAACFALAVLSCSQANAQSSEIAALRDSLDAIQYDLPKVPTMKCPKKVITIRTQEQWDNLWTTIEAELKRGAQNVEIRVKGKGLVMPTNPKTVSNLNYPKANIRIVGNDDMVAQGQCFEKSKARQEGAFWSLPYTDYDVNDMVTDGEGNEIPLREEVSLVNGDIVKVQEFRGSKVQDVWRFQVDLPDLTEVQCKDFYVLMTRDWTSARHKVVIVQDGWLYYHLDSEDLHSDRNPNVDWIQYRVRPRYRLINSPVSKGVHIAGGRIYVPNKYKEARVNKGGVLLLMGYCIFNSIEITGFAFKGCGNKTPIGIYHSTFNTGAFIHDNTFTDMVSTCIGTAWSENVMIANNTITNTWQQAIAGGGNNCTVSGNRLKKIGWLLNTRAITGGGERMHICNNIIEDFNYDAIAVGSTTANEKAQRLTYVIERNTIRLTKDFTDNFIQNTLADGGGIYIGPQCTQGIIRNNVVENIKGIHSNRGIFLDDGAKNLAIYGNLIVNTANSYDIDFRFDRGYESSIPDHNTNNCVFQNIMTGGYRFQDAGAGSNCIGGGNILLGTGPAQKTVVELKRRAADVEAGSASVETVMKKIQVDRFVKKQLKQRR